MEDVGHCLVIFDTVAQSVDAKIAMPSVQAFSGEPDPLPPQ
jgi:hypothetical protein